MSLSGKVAIVTGGAGGIGLAIVNLFLSQGAKVGVVDIIDLDQFASNESVLGLECDISQDAQVNKAVDKVLEKWGKLDVLVNNAAIMDEYSPAGDVSDAVWDRTLKVNVNGTMYFSRRAIKVFLGQESRGSIVNVASTAAYRGAAAGVAYTTSKHAVIGLTRNTAYMYAKDNITCNVVAPGYTPGTNIVSDLSKLNPSGHARTQPFVQVAPGVMEKEDIANVVLFLATAKNINGAEVAADKGYLTA